MVLSSSRLFVKEILCTCINKLHLCKIGLTFFLINKTCKKNLVVVVGENFSTLRNKFGDNERCILLGVRMRKEKKGFL